MTSVVPERYTEIDGVVSYENLLFAYANIKGTDQMRGNRTTDERI